LLGWPSGTFSLIGNHEYSYASQLNSFTHLRAVLVLHD
jgi:hypothetical protein